MNPDTWTKTDSMVEDAAIEYAEWASENAEEAAVELVKHVHHFQIIKFLAVVLKSDPNTDSSKEVTQAALSLLGEALISHEDEIRDGIVSRHNDERA